MIMKIKRLRLSSIAVAYIVSFLAPLALFIPQASAATVTWDGEGSDNNWSTATNWSADTVPSNGDTLVFPTSVDADTTTGDDRLLNNDLSSMSFAGIQVTGDYITSDYDYYNIDGNAFTITGNIAGNPNTNETPYLKLSTDITLGAAGLEIASVQSTGGITAGTYSFFLKGSHFDGGLSGSGGVTVSDVDTPLGNGGGACSGVATAPVSTPFGGDSSGFSGFVNVVDYSVSVSGRANDLLSNAAGVTINSGSSIVFNTDNGSDMTFDTPLVLNGGTLITRQMYDAECNAPASVKTVTLSGSINATATVSVTMSYANLTLSGTVTGADNITVQEGTSATPALTVGSTVSHSALKTTTVTGDHSSTDYDTQENNLLIISADATAKDISVNGGTLKGTGTVGVITMASGSVAPGQSPGCLSSGNLNYIGGSLDIELAGTTVCTEYDQQTVTGTVSLGSDLTTLNTTLLNSYKPALNSTYTIISNDASDAVTGTFKGLAEGATFQVSGYTFSISYKGGDGNDVVLTTTAVPATATAPDTGIGSITSNPIVVIISMLLCGGTLFGIRKMNS